MPFTTAIKTSEPTLDDTGHGKDVSVQIDVKAFVGARALVQANSGGGKSRTLRRILEQTHGRVQHIVVDVEGEFYTLREQFDYLIAGHGGDCPATVKNAGRLVTMLLKTGASAILDISELADHDQQAFVQAVCEALVSAPRDIWHPVLVAIDEAQRFCPQDEEAVSTRAVIDLMTRGRKRGYGGVLACQRLSELHKSAAAECNNLIIGRTSLDVDIARARKALGMKAKDAETILPRLKPGEFFCVGPGLTEVVHKVWVGHVVTTHPEAGSGQVPMAPARAVTKAMLAELADLDEQAATEESELERLRKQVAELEDRPTQSWATPDSVELKKEIVNLRTEVVRLRAELATAEKFSEVEAELLDKAVTLLNEQADHATDLVNEIANRLQDAAEGEVVVDVPEAPTNGAHPLDAIDDIQPRSKAQDLGTLAMPPMIRSFLTVLAQHSTGPRCRPLTKQQILVYAGYARGGATARAFAEIERQKWWAKGSADGYVISDEGLEALGPYEALPRREKLRERIASELGPMERAFFKTICIVYPKSISKAAILNATNYARGGATARAFAHLVNRDWVVQSGKGSLVASNELFE